MIILFALQICLCPSKIFHPLSLTPALSRWEKENYSPLLSNISGWIFPGLRLLRADIIVNIQVILPWMVPREIALHRVRHQMPPVVGILIIAGDGAV